jgi:hypothetical protein
VQGHGKDTEILEGGFGVLFPRYVFDSFPLFYPMTKNNTNMYLSDDYVIGKFLDSKGFKKKVIYHSWAGRAGDDWSTICSWNEGSQTHSLSKLGNLERYMELNL